MLKNILIKIILKKGLRSDEILPSIFYKYKFLKNIIIDVDVYALLRSQYWSREEIQSLQFERIKNITNHAYKYVPFWKKRLGSIKINPEKSFTWDDFLRIPITSKRDFKNKKIQDITDKKILETIFFSGQTSGSTGEPFKFFLDKYFDLRSIAICQRMFITNTKGKLLPMIHIRAAYRYGFAHKKSIMFFAYDYNHLKYRMEKLEEETKKINGPYLLYGFSSYIIEIAKLCSEKKIKINPFSVVITGETIDNNQKEKIETSLNTKVYRAYATNELGWLTQECEYNKLHINSEFVYLEVVDMHGNNLKNGEQGRIIITSFDNKIMPFIRYDTGDVGTISGDICSCGRTSKQIEIVGRQTDMIKLSKGREVPFINLLGIFRQNDDIIKQFQFVQKDKNEFTIKIIPEKFIDDLRLLEIKIALCRILQNEIQINFEIVKEIEPAASGKKINFRSLV